MTPVPKTQKRIGLFGGSFDPVHVGHRALAMQAADQLQLDELRWIPAGQPWQKTGRQLASARDRAAMVALSLQGDPRFRLDPSELRRTGPSYTIDTVMALREQAPRAQLFLILGQDQYARFHTWNSWRELLSQVTLAVTRRDGHAPRPSSELAQTWHRLVVLHMAPSAASSTAVREHLREPRLLAEVLREFGREAGRQRIHGEGFITRCPSSADRTGYEIAGTPAALHSARGVRAAPYTHRGVRARLRADRSRNSRR